MSPFVLHHVVGRGRGACSVTSDGYCWSAARGAIQVAGITQRLRAYSSYSTERLWCPRPPSPACSYSLLWLQPRPLRLNTGRYVALYLEPRISRNLQTHVADTVWWSRLDWCHSLPVWLRMHGLKPVVLSVSSRSRLAWSFYHRSWRWITNQYWGCSQRDRHPLAGQLLHPCSGE